MFYNSCIARFVANLEKNLNGTMKINAGAICF